MFYHARVAHATLAMLHGSLAHSKANGERIWIHCETWAPGTVCNHSAQLDWDDLINRFGPDFIIPKARSYFLSQFHCSKCGGKDLGLIVLPSKGSEKGGGAGPTVW